MQFSKTSFHLLKKINVILTSELNHLISLLIVNQLKNVSLDSQKYFTSTTTSFLSGQIPRLLTDKNRRRLSVVGG